jgi:putative tryptophan/tyrosine transport system substrate-binding protein
MRRRDVVTFLCTAVATWTLRPLGTRAQQPTVPVVGFLAAASPDAFPPWIAAFRQGLEDTGYVENRNVAVAYRYASNEYDQLPALAADLVRRQVAVIFTFGGIVAARAAKAATATIPIVFSTGNDPVEFGLVPNLNRPGGNVTGVSLFAGTLLAKRVELLRMLVPDGAAIGMLVNTRNPIAESELREMQALARTGGWPLHVANASTEGDLDTAFATLARQQVRALLVGTDSLFLDRREQIAGLARLRAIPTIYTVREYTAVGGLMSYGANYSELYRQAGIYVGAILKGANPADLPVRQPTRFELVINLKTAKALGLDVPATLLALADEVIE